MIRLGVTGGIGMGKSGFAESLRALGVRVVDTDDLAREVVRPGSEGLAEIAQAFGGEMLTPHGELDRARLASVVFRNRAKRARLEAITHPRIRALWMQQLASWEAEGRQTSAVIVPLLYETNAAPSFDAVVCVACSPASQLERLRARGWSDLDIQSRIAAQMPVLQKIAAADFLVWTEGPIERRGEQAELVLERLALRGGAGAAEAARR